MKKPKFQIKIDRNNRCHIYFNNKWVKDVVMCNFTANIESREVFLEKYVRDSRGRLIVNDDSIVTEKRLYKI